MLIHQVNLPVILRILKHNDMHLNFIHLHIIPAGHTCALLWKGQLELLRN